MALGIAVAWTGFLASDDASYVLVATEWVNGLPASGISHYWTRYTFVAPLAGLIEVFGFSETTVSMLPLGVFLILALSTYAGVRHWFGEAAALAATALLAVTPLFAFYASIAFPDMMETLFIAAAMWLFLRTVERERKAAWLVLVGVLLGLAVVNRLTALGILVVYGLLFLRGAYFSRWLYWLMAIGFIVVLGIDGAYHLATKDDALYRFSVAYRSIGGVTKTLALSDYGTGTGNLSDDQFLAPIASVFLNQEFGFLFYLAIAGFVLLWRDRSLSPAQRRLVTVCGLTAAVWFVWIGYSHVVRPLPRYFMVASYSAVLLCAVGFGQMVLLRRSWLAGIVLLGLVGSNFALILLDNDNPRFGERTLARLAASHQEPIGTDPESAVRARYFLQWAGAADPGEITTAPPQAGQLYLHNPRSMHAHSLKVPRFDTAPYTPTPSWQAVETFRDWRFVGTVLDLLQARRWLPASIYDRVAWPNQVTLYRVGPPG